MLSQLVFHYYLQDSGKAGDKKDVIELTDSNFEEEVLNTKDLVLVEFFAPWLVPLNFIIQTFG